MKQMELWAQFIKKHPTAWKRPHTEFVNTLYQKAQGFVQWLAQQPGGKEKIIDIYGIKNREAYPKLLG